MTGPRLPRAVREQQMIDAALRVFSARGYHDASMDEIAERAGISKPMVYAYLGSKEELFVACLHREATKLGESLAAAAGSDLTPADQLWRGLCAAFGFVAAHRDGWRVLYRQARSQEPFAAEVAAMREQLVGVVEGLLQRAVLAAGNPASPSELRAMAYALAGAIESLADRLVDTGGDPIVTATRLMNLVWLGAGNLLAGDEWQPTSPPPPLSTGSGQHPAPGQRESPLVPVQAASVEQGSDESRAQ